MAYIGNISKKQCLRCSGTMESIGVEKIQLGQTGLLVGIWSNILAGSLEVDIYICSICGKVEFYSVDLRDYDSNLPQKTCPQCGDIHDSDYPKCPRCKYKY